MSGKPLTLGRGAEALAAGAAAGAGLTALPVIVVSPPTFLLVLLLAYPVWLFGLVFMGVPVWTMLHHAGVRSGPAAAGFGGAVTFAGSLLLGHDIGLEGWPLLLGAGALAVAGVVAGWVVQRVGYGGRPDGPGRAVQGTGGFHQ